MRVSDTDDIIRELFRSFLHNYQEESKIIKGSDFVFESVALIYYKLHIVRLMRGGSYIKSPEWLLHEKATINPKNKNVDDKNLERKNKALLLMINDDDDEKYNYFAVKSKLELFSSE